MDDAAEGEGIGSPLAVDETDEPRLKYSALSHDTPFPGAPLRLAVSDKVLALGTSTGAVLILDYNGNQVHAFKEHHAAVTELSFDQTAEYLGSSSEDGTVVIHGLYTGEVRRHKCGGPVTTVTLDPRYGSRKTREFVYGTASGQLNLVSKGWLGVGETALYRGGRGGILRARASGSLLAWVTLSGLRVYDTASHTRLARLPSPPGLTVDSPVSLFWLGSRELYVGWASNVLVLRVSQPPPVPKAGAAAYGVPPRRMETVVSFTVPFRVFAVAPFGVELSVLGSVVRECKDEHDEKGTDSEPVDSPTRLAVKQGPKDHRGDEPVVATSTSSENSSPSRRGRGTDIQIDMQEHPGFKPSALVESGDKAGDRTGAPDTDEAQAQPEETTDVRGGESAALPTAHAEAGNVFGSPFKKERQEEAEEAAATATQGGAVAQTATPEEETAAVSCVHRDEGQGCPSSTMESTDDQALPSESCTPTTATKQQQQPEEEKQEPYLHILDRRGRILSSDLLDCDPGVTLAVFYTESARAASRRVIDPVLVRLRTPSASSLQDLAASADGGKASAEVDKASAEVDRASAKVDKEVAQSGEDGSTSVQACKTGESMECTSPTNTTVSACATNDGRPSPGVRVHTSVADSEAALTQPYKWWRDGDEPLYFFTSRRGVLVGRPRDGNDRVEWLSARGRALDALVVARTDGTVKGAVREVAGERYLQSLADAGDWAGAAAAAPDILAARQAAWERWVHAFAGAAHLRDLAPRLPTSRPQLRPRTYDMVLQALLVDPKDHALLLDLVRHWPPAAYSGGELLGGVLARLATRRTGVPTPSPDLTRIAAELYERRGQHAHSLTLRLALQDPDAFDYVERHGLLSTALEHITEFFRLDPARATALCVARPADLPPAAVVGQLSAAAETTAEPDAARAWRAATYGYLEALHGAEPGLASPFAGLQVDLGAEFAPESLGAFLRASSSYPLERALRTCEVAGLVEQQVYVLARMGDAGRALRLIVEHLRDMPRAVEFVQQQQDEELWGELVGLAMQDAELTGMLLDQAGGTLDPLTIVAALPPGMDVPHLRTRLARAIAGSRGSASLQAGCAAVLRSDLAQLAARLQAALAGALAAPYLRLAEGRVWERVDRGAKPPFISAGGNETGGLASAFYTGLQNPHLSPRHQHGPAVTPPSLPPTAAARRIRPPTGECLAGNPPNDEPGTWIGVARDAGDGTWEESAAQEQAPPPPSKLSPIRSSRWRGAPSPVHAT